MLSAYYQKRDGTCEGCLRSLLLQRLGLVQEAKELEAYVKLEKENEPLVNKTRKIHHFFSNLSAVNAVW